MKRKLNKILAITVLATILLTPAIDTMAYINPGGANIGNGACNAGDGSGGAHMVVLASVPNTVKDDKTRHTNQDYMSAEGKYLGDVFATMLTTHRNYIDPLIFNTTKMESATFYPRDGWSNRDGRNLYLNIDDGMGQATVYNFDNMDGSVNYYGKPYDNYTRQAAWAPNFYSNPAYWGKHAELMSGMPNSAGVIWSDRSPEMADKYIDAVFNGKDAGLMSEVQALAKQIYEGYANDQGELVEAIKCFTQPTPKFDNGDRRAGYTLELYTAIVIESERSRNVSYNGIWVNTSGREMIKKFWATRNEDESAEFIIVADMAVAGQMDVAPRQIAHAYSYTAALNKGGVQISNDRLSEWFEEAYPSKKSSYTGGYNKDVVHQRELADARIIRDKSGFTGVSNQELWVNHYFSNNRISGGGGLLSYSGGSKDYWTESIGWESSVRMVDAKGNVIGMPGFAYYAGSSIPGGGTSTNHGPDPKPDPKTPENPMLSLVCSPHTTKVETPGSNANMITIDIKSTASSQQISQIWSYFQSELLGKDQGSTMQIKYRLSARTDEGNPVDGDFYNIFSKGNGTFIPAEGNTFLSSEKLTSKADLTDFLTGPKSSLTLQDTTITVNDKVVNTYIATMYICMNGNGKHEDYIGMGTGYNLTDNGMACDTATLYTKETPYFYSDMRHKPVAEIKADKPYNESYEAMAGVPTTTNLYVGAGATEFMVNVDLQMKTTQGERTYIFEVTEAKCYGTNQGCTISDSCGGPSETTDDEGNPTHGGPHNATCPWLGNPVADSVQHHRNDKHPGSCKYTYTIKQPINAVNYMDIIGEDIWRLLDIKLAGKSVLMNPSQIAFTPNLGYYTFYNQEGYSNNNGRFRFNVSLASNAGTGGEHWGDTKSNIPQGTVSGLHTVCQQKACDAINAVVGSLTTNTVTCVSDYMVLETSEGYQNVMYFEQTSNNVPLNGMTVTPEDFPQAFSDGEGTTSLTCNKVAPPITWAEAKTQEQMWDKNSNAASKGTSPDFITTTGYNGDYANVSGKYNNDNSTSGTNVSKLNVNWNQPNADIKNGNTNFEGDVNSRYIKTGINIIDSTTPPPDRKWSAADSIKPVTNGEWDTGNATVLYTQDVDYKSTGGRDWSAWEKRKEVPYSEEHEKINNIVVHNPISNRDAIVISNDEKYDDRYWGELDKPTPPKGKGACPRTSSCTFSTLSCTQSAPHSESCYKMIDVGYNCSNKPLNTHVHDANCLHTHVAACYDVGSKTWRYNSNGCSEDGYTFTTEGWVNDPANEAREHMPHGVKCWNKASFALISSTPGGIICGYGTNGSMTKEFPFINGVEQYKVDRDGEYTLEVWGAEGGGWGQHSDAPGGYAKGIVNLKAGEILYICAGAKGSCSTSHGTNSYDGYNGGGNGGGNGNNGAGGATHIAKKSGELRSLVNSKESVLIVAGGGGSNGYWGETGKGGGLSGGDSSNNYDNLGVVWYKTGGTQTGPGKDGYKGGFGYGGYGLNSGGAGGGGWYGGSGLGTFSSQNGGGGGGSGYIGGVLNGTMSTGVNSGHGRAVITRKGCTNVPNTHTHTANCNKKEKLLACTNVHHYVANSQPHDVKDPKNHNSYADSRCYKYCGNDSKHKLPETINIPGGQPSSSNGAFINIDREFTIYYPDMGDYEQQPKLNGISECTDSKGKGYKNSMDTDTWLRNKFVIYPFNTLDAANNLWGAGEPIDLLKLPSNNKKYTFTCLLANSERNGCSVTFHSVANNAPESLNYDDADSYTNYERGGNHAAKMSVTKRQEIDVVGSIGSLTINDTGDPRFAELFKQPINNGKWLIPNVVREVDYELPSKIVSDDVDSRNEPTSVTGYNHDVYGVTTMPTGGKSFPYVKLPLVPYKNNIKALQKENMRPGYNLYMDIETVGNYIGDNWQDDTTNGMIPWERGNDASGMFTKKMQIKPKYWELNLDTGKYSEVDAYMYSGSSYLPIVMSDKKDQVSEYYYYLDWLNESARRSYTMKEQKNSTAYQAANTNDIYKFRLPTNERDVIGQADRIYLIDIDRTLIGSSFRYGKDYNTGNINSTISDNRMNELDFVVGSQRWHWTLGLPSSTVFVKKGDKPTTANIDKIQDANSVIVCSLDIKVRGEVWTLEYDGTAVNYSDGTGFKIYPGGKTYPPPIDPVTNKPINDPIIVVYDNERTSKDDIQTQGSH